MTSRACHLTTVAFAALGVLWNGSDGVGAGAAAPVVGSAPSVIRRFELAPMELGRSQARIWRDAGRSDRGLRLGGIFSGLSRLPGDRDDTFYCVADRGPNGEVEIEGERRRTFPVPDYSPVLYRIQVEGTSLRIVDQVGIRTRRGKPVTGLPNTDADETPYAFDGRQRLSLNVNGLDVEGLAMARDGTFWIADEYRPSVARVARNGKVITRWIPRGVKLAADTDVRAVLPSIYARRRLNRGFEGVALSPDGSRVFAVMESPLEFPDREQGRSSRMIRILVLDAHQKAPVAEHVYVADQARTLGEESQGEIRLSDVTCVNRNTLLVVERGRRASRIYAVELGGATNILHGPWDEPRNTRDALESLDPDQLVARRVVPVRKSLLVDLTELPGVPSKIEGLAIVDPTTLALGNDNDFGFSDFDARGRAIHTDIRSTLLLVRIPTPLPVER